MANDFCSSNRTMVYFLVEIMGNPSIHESYSIVFAILVNLLNILDLNDNNFPYFSSSYTGSYI